MLICMRTTINLPDGLVTAARQRAQEQGRTFTSMVEEGLRAVLDSPAIPVQERPLPSYGSSQGSFLIDLEDRDAVAAALDADGPR